MTRHGMLHISAAGYQPLAEDPRTPMMIIVVDVATFNRKPGQQYRTQAQQCGLFAPKHALADGTSAVAHISGKSKSP